MAQTQLQKTKTACTSSINGGFALLKDNVDHWSNHGDWEPLAYLLVNHREAPVLRRVTSYVMADHVKFITGKEAKGSKWGAVFEYDKKSNGLLRLDSDGQAGFYDDLCTMVSKKYGIKGKIKVRTADGDKNVIAHTHFFPSVKKTNDKTDAEKIEARVKSAEKWAKDNGMSLTALIAALQEAAKA